MKRGQRRKLVKITTQNLEQEILDGSDMQHA
jgi:hypothetical protein